MSTSVCWELTCDGLVCHTGESMTFICLKYYRNWRYALASLATRLIKHLASKLCKLQWKYLSDFQRTQPGSAVRVRVLNVEDLGSRLRLLNGFVSGDSRGKFTMLCTVNCQLVCLLPVGILTWGKLF